LLAWGWVPTDPPSRRTARPSRVLWAPGPWHRPPRGDDKRSLNDLLLIVAGICGALGQAIGGYSRGGCLVSIALGFIGALIGMGLARALNLPELFLLQVDSTAFPVVWSIIGSALFVAVLGFLTRGGRNRVP